ncbi:hypothetical protein L226DRAFT_583094, partial [Lentinus tigrinus ALCF2SS1-7]|uniref:uncharacterized protein n=1 Tax=Lentinus tigrinus ALCF2SS1-7 TaxID=1328758 RepID=UPI001165D925
ANIGIVVEGATDAARSAVDIVLTEPGLSRIIHAIRGSRLVLRNYVIYAFAVTILIVCFAILAFAFKFDFPSFTVLIITLLNDGTIITFPVTASCPRTSPIVGISARS